MLNTVGAIQGARQRASMLYQAPEAFLAELASMEEMVKDVTKAEREDWLRKNWNRQEFADAVKFQVQKDVLAHIYGLAFFQNVTLADNEWPMLTSESDDDQIKCWYIGQNNGVPKHQWVPVSSYVQHLLKKYSTEEVEYKLLDLQKGNVSESERIQNRLRYEFNKGIDAQLMAILTSGRKASGLRALLNLDPDIVAANVPDANYLDSSGGADDTHITIAKLKSWLAYFVSFASDVELDGVGLEPRTLFISSKNLPDIWDFVDIVAGYNAGGAVIMDPKNTVPSSVKDAIFRTGRMSNFYGYALNIVTRNTIAQGEGWISSNKPCGYYFTKPGMGEVYRDEATFRRQNKGKMSQSEVHAMVMPDEWIYRYLSVKF